MGKIIPVDFKATTHAKRDQKTLWAAANKLNAAIQKQLHEAYRFHGTLGVLSREINDLERSVGRHAEQIKKSRDDIRRQRLESIRRVNRMIEKTLDALQSPTKE